MFFASQRCSFEITTVKLEITLCAEFLLIISGVNERKKKSMCVRLFFAPL